MSVYKKLQQARVKFHKLALKKSGRNKYAEYNYFELGDFIPQVQEIFGEVGLCGTVSFPEDKACLSVVDVENPSDCIVFTSSVAEVQLKGCLPIQGIGAAQTYLRRYLWVLAMEIVENDQIDAAETNVAETKQVKTAKAESKRPSDYQQQQPTPDAGNYQAKAERVDPQKVLEAIRDMDALIMKGDGDWVGVSKLWAGLSLEMKHAVWPKLEKPTQVFLTEEKSKRVVNG